MMSAMRVQTAYRSRKAQSALRASLVDGLSVQLGLGSGVRGAVPPSRSFYSKGLPAVSENVFAAHTSAPLTTEAVQEWLVEKVAYKLGVTSAEVNPDQYFDEFDLDSTEALVLSGELENWLGFELETTALWYHPTIAELSRYIAGKKAGNAAG